MALVRICAGHAGINRGVALAACDDTNRGISALCQRRSWAAASATEIIERLSAIDTADLRVMAVYRSNGTGGITRSAGDTDTRWLGVSASDAVYGLHRAQVRYG